MAPSANLYTGCYVSYDAVFFSPSKINKKTRVDSQAAHDGLEKPGERKGGGKKSKTIEYKSALATIVIA